jgi:hypothetical protein
MVLAVLLTRLGDILMRHGYFSLTELIASNRTLIGQTWPSIALQRQ